MTRDLIIGVDAGTSLIKAVAFDLEGREVGLAATANRIAHVADGGVEQDMEWTWQATAETLRTLGSKVEALAGRAAGLAITAQGDGTWLIDARGEPVAPAWLWLDGRSGAIVRELRQSAAGAQLCSITGTGLNPSNQSGQLLWLKRHRPDVLARADKALHCKDWLYFKACGEIATDLAEGVFTFGDYRRLAYDDRVIELLGLREHRRLLPPLVDGSNHYGALTEAAARATGLTAGTPVVLAPLDVPCTTLGAGAYAPGKDVGCSILGSTGMHSRMYYTLDEAQPCDQVGYIMAYPVPGTRAGFMSHMAATLNIDWALGLIEEAAALATGEPRPRGELLAKLEQKVGAARPAAMVFHPFICENGERGPFVEPAARAQLLGFTNHAGLFELVRAIYEGIAFATRDCYEALGAIPEEIRLTGGAAKSRVMRAILASALGSAVRVSRREEAGAAGAAIVAAVSLGHYASFADALPSWVDAYLEDTTQAPEAAMQALYERLFPLYRQSYGALADFWHDLDHTRKAQSSWPR